MSVEFTESFMRFQRQRDDAAYINRYLQAGGFAVRTYNQSGALITDGSLGADTTAGKWEIVADPNFASRNALRSFALAPPNNTVRAVVAAQTLKAPSTHWICGFRVKLERSATAGSSRVAICIGSASIAKTTTSTVTSVNSLVAANTWDTLLVIEAQQGFVGSAVTGTLTSVPFSTSLGMEVYVEIEVDTVANLFRAWIDNQLVVDAAVPGGSLAAAKAAYDNGFGVLAGWAQPTSAGGNYGVITIRDLYCLSIDATAPNVRLGPTTQVIGELPDADVQAQFNRPVEYATNAEVAALPVIPAPSVYLAATAVGQEDRYTAATSIATAASLIHAVGVKAQVANYDASNHSVAAVVKHSTESDVVDMGVTTPATGFKSVYAYSTINPSTGVAWTPPEAAASEFGLRVTS